MFQPEIFLRLLPEQFFWLLLGLHLCRLRNHPHHDPHHDDDMLDQMEVDAKKLFPNTSMAREGLTIRL